MGPGCAYVQRGLWGKWRSSLFSRDPRRKGGRPGGSRSGAPIPSDDGTIRLGVLDGEGLREGTRWHTVKCPRPQVKNQGQRDEAATGAASGRSREGERRAEGAEFCNATLHCRGAASSNYYSRVPCSSILLLARDLAIVGREFFENPGGLWGFHTNHSPPGGLFR